MPAAPHVRGVYAVSQPTRAASRTAVTLSMRKSAEAHTQQPSATIAAINALTPGGKVINGVVFAVDIGECRACDGKKHASLARFVVTPPSRRLFIASSPDAAYLRNMAQSPYRRLFLEEAMPFHRCRKRPRRRRHGSTHARRSVGKSIATTRQGSQHHYCYFTRETAPALMSSRAGHVDC